MIRRSLSEPNRTGDYFAEPSCLPVSSPKERPRPEAVDELPVIYNNSQSIFSPIVTFGPRIEGKMRHVCVLRQSRLQGLSRGPKGEVMHACGFSRNVIRMLEGSCNICLLRVGDVAVGLLSLDLPFVRGHIVQ